MKFMVVLVAFSYTIIANCAPSELPVNPGGIGGLFKGPNSETIIKGPDGSVITAAVNGGAVIPDTNLEPIIVAEPVTSIVTETVQATPLLAQTVVVAESQPILPQTAIVTERALEVSAAPIQINHQDVHVIETEIVDAPAVEPQQSSTLVGPSGTISTKGSKSIISGPASTTISEPATASLEPPLIATNEGFTASLTVPLSAASTSIDAGSISTFQPQLSSVAPINIPPQLSVSTLAAPLDIAPSRQDISNFDTQSQLASSEFALPLGITSSRQDLGNLAAQPQLSVNTLAQPLSIGRQDIANQATYSQLPSAAPINIPSDRIDIDNIQPQLPVSVLSSPLTKVTSRQDISRLDTQSQLALTELASPLGITSPRQDFGTLAAQHQLSVSTKAPPLSVSPSRQDLGDLTAQSVPSIETASSYGVINNAASAVDQASIYSSTILPVTESSVLSSSSRSQLANIQGNIEVGNGQISDRGVQNILDQPAIINQQLLLNPSNIPAANIIPPEIGLRGQGLVSNIQRIAPTTTENGFGIDGRLALQENISPNLQQSVPSQVELSNRQTLDSRNLIDPNSVAGQTPSLARAEILGPEIAKYRIDPSQISLATIPLSQVVRIPANSRPPPNAVEESPSAIWGRYGRQNR